MTAIELLNLALLKIGVSKGVASLTEASREAWTGALVHDHTLRATLRHFPWPFATKYRGCTEEASYKLYLASGPLWDTDPAALTLVQAWSATATYVRGDVVRLTDVNYTGLAEHTNQTPPNATYWSTSADDHPRAVAGGDWRYAYRWPSDCLFLRRVLPEGVAGTGRTFEPFPPPFRVGRDPNGLLVYTNAREAVIEFTTIDCDALWADDLWIDAFTWRLAAALAPSLSQIAEMPKTCQLMYEQTISRAAIVASREHQPEPHGEAEWIRGRA